MSSREMESLVRRLKSLKNRQEMLQQEIDQIEDDLKCQLTSWDVEEAQAGPFRILWKRIDTEYRKFRIV